MLIITQKVDSEDPDLSFFHEWIREFAEQCKQVTVICLYKGTYSLPTNVTVLSLGKETRASKIAYITRFYSYVWKERKNYDTVFVHMTPLYIILGAWLWNLVGKKVSLWYAHKSVDTKLRIAEKMTDIIFTSTKESFRLPSNKVIVAGQGINTDLFKPVQKQKNNSFTIITVGRITRIKNVLAMVQAVELLHQEGLDVTFEICGQTLTSQDKEYYKEVQDYIQQKSLKNVSFVGTVLNNVLSEYLVKGDVFINMSDTGSLDKTVLEAMSCGIPVITSNTAFKPMLTSFDLFIEESKAPLLYLKIKTLMGNSEVQNKNSGMKLREIVVRDHNLKGLISNIKAGFNNFYH